MAEKAAHEVGDGLRQCAEPLHDHRFLSGFDPEVAYSGSGDGVELGAVAYNYPQVKVVTMGVELKF